MAQYIQSYRSEVGQLAAANFLVVPHAIESFRVRISKVSATNAHNIVRDAVVAAAKNQQNPLRLNRSVKEDGWQATIRSPNHTFDVIIKQNTEKGPQPLVVATVMENVESNSRLTRFDLGRRVSLQEHLDIEDDYERRILRLEDKNTYLEHALSQSRQRTRHEIAEFLAEVTRLLDVADDPDSARLAEELVKQVRQFPIE